MPEFLDDGTHVAGILWDFLQMAPEDSAGPVFQTTTKKRIPIPFLGRESRGRRGLFPSTYREP